MFVKLASHPSILCFSLAFLAFAGGGYLWLFPKKKLNSAEVGFMDARIRKEERIVDRFSSILLLQYGFWILITGLISYHISDEFYAALMAVPSVIFFVYRYLNKVETFSEMVSQSKEDLPDY